MRVKGVERVRGLERRRESKRSERQLAGLRSRAARQASDLLTGGLGQVESVTDDDLRRLEDDVGRRGRLRARKDRGRKGQLGSLTVAGPSPPRELQNRTHPDEGRWIVLRARGLIAGHWRATRGSASCGARRGGPQRGEERRGSAPAGLRPPALARPESRRSTHLVPREDSGVETLRGGY